jgi:PAS domain S-box-containing protein
MALAFLHTNDFHHLLFRAYEFNGDVVPLYGPAGWTFVFYNLGLRVVSIVTLAWLCIRSPQHRLPAVLIMLAEIVVGIVLVMDPYIEESQFFYVPEKAIPVAACAIALFGYRIFDPIPLARQTVIEQLQAGMLVLDLEGRVVSLNPAAEGILNVPAKQIKGKLVKELLPAYQEKRLGDAGETEIELGFEGTGMRYYMLTNSLLKDFRGFEVGSLLLLRDVTEQKRAQAQILEQQKVQAALEERAGLARELHDSIDQSLAAAQLQAEIAHELVDRGEIAAVHATLSRLVEITQSGHIDIRQYLLGARTLLKPGQDVFVALQQFVRQFSRDFGPVTELVIAPEIKERGLDSRAEVQLIRIVQEALANVRKHAHASAAQVVFSLQDDRIQVRIEDDGVGFDVARLFRVEGPRFGLRSMRERAEAIGGTFQILSTPGRGTRVVVEVPYKSAGAGPGRTDYDYLQSDASREHLSVDCDHPVPSD